MNKPLTILVAGTANPHVPGYLRGAKHIEHELKIIAVSDFDEVRINEARNLLHEQPGIRYFNDYQAMFDAFPEADCVMIGSDNIDHYPMFLEATRRNYHIYMMKVISMDEEECVRMIAIGRNYSKVINCELELHFNPQFVYAKKIVESGALGQIQSIYLSNISQSPCNYFPNWGNPLLSYGKRIPIRPGATVYRGGAITDHPHPYDMIRWLTGLEFRTVNAVSAKNQRAHLEVEDHAAITGELSNGTKYFINPSYSNLEEKVPARRLLWPKSLECNLKITGSRGYFACDYFDRHVYVVGSDFASPNRLIVDAAALTTSDQTMIKNFIACIRKERPRPETTLEDSYAAIRVMNAAYDSIYHNRQINLS